MLVIETPDRELGYKYPRSVRFKQTPAACKQSTSLLLPFPGRALQPEQYCALLGRVGAGEGYPPEVQGPVCCVGDVRAHEQGPPHR